MAAVIIVFTVISNALAFIVTNRICAAFCTITTFSITSALISYKLGAFSVRAGGAAGGRPSVLRGAAAAGGGRRRGGRRRGRRGDRRGGGGDRRWMILVHGHPAVIV